MITTPTVLILGAGASMCFGYPSGIQLKQRILEDRPSFPRIAAKIGLNDQHFCDDLFTSGKTSVDAFLEHRQDLINIGKFAIARILIGYESDEILFNSNNENWYDYLLQQMNCKFADFPKNKITFITFNYDRTLEHYLFKTLKSSYKEKDQTVAEILNQIPIIHVHGKLGNLPWQGPDGRPYSSTDNSSYIINAAQGIKIISEISDVEINFAPVVTPLQEAKRIIFLGFGYNSTNLKRLFFEFNPLGSQYPEIYGTGVGLTRLEQTMIAGDFGTLTKMILKIGGPGQNILSFLRQTIMLSA